MDKQARLLEVEQELLGYKDLAYKIDKLRDEKKQLKKQIEDEKFNSLPFMERFRSHVFSHRGKVLGDLFDLQRVAGWIKSFVDSNRGHYERYRTYHLDCLEEELAFLYSEEDKELWFTEMLKEEECDFDNPEEVASLREAYQKDYDEYVQLAEKLMKDNIGGWVCDW